MSVYINVIGILINLVGVPLLMLTIHALVLVAVMYYDVD